MYLKYTSVFHYIFYFISVLVGIFVLHLLEGKRAQKLALNKL